MVALPGHTAGSIGLLCVEKRLLLVSDAINGNLWLFLPESTKLSVYQQTLEKASGLDFDFMLQGHAVGLIPKIALHDYQSAAAAPDFAHGRPEPDNEFSPGVNARTCPRPGMTTLDFYKKRYAAVVLSQDKL